MAEPILVSTHLAAAMKLVKEGRMEEFTKRMNAIPQGGNYTKALDDLLLEFGIEVVHEKKPFGPGLRSWIYRGSTVLT